MNRLMFKFRYGEGEDTVPAGTGDGKGGVTPPPKTYSEADYHKGMAAVRREAEGKVAKQIEDAKRQISELSVIKEDKGQLEAKLAELNQTLMSQEERAKLEVETTKKKYETELKAAQDTASGYKGKYENFYVQQNILAAAAADAVNPMQILDILTPKAKIVTVDGRDIVKVPVNVRQKDGTFKTVEAPPEEALTLMRGDTALYGNLFKSTLRAGTGDNNNPGGGGNKQQKDIKDMSAAEFETFRKGGYV